MKRNALIVYGGWAGHEPEKVANVFKDILEESDFEVELSNTLEVYEDKEKLKSLDLIVPHWTMGELRLEQLESVLEAVASGVGIAGCHAGLCDAFHASVDWHFMAGGQFVAHIGAAGIDGHGLGFKVNIKKGSSPIVEGIEDFIAYDEQYYLQVDPSIKVLATTKVPSKKGPYESDKTAKINFEYGIGLWNFEESAVTTGPHVENGIIDMPVVWTKYWGKGRVFYNSLGHDEKRINQKPSIKITKRGFSWAAKQRI